MACDGQIAKASWLCILAIWRNPKTQLPMVNTKIADNSLNRNYVTIPCRGLSPLTIDVCKKTPHPSCPTKFTCSRKAPTSSNRIPPPLPPVPPCERNFTALHKARADVRACVPNCAPLPHAHHFWHFRPIAWPRPPACLQ